MRRNFDHIRKLHFQVELGGRVLNNYEQVSLDDMDEEQAGYALRLMHDKGLIIALRSNECGVPEFNTFNDIPMTWEGHDFIYSIRDKQVWKRTKEGAAAAGVFIFDLVKPLDKEFVKKKMEANTGLELEI